MVNNREKLQNRKKSLALRPCVYYNNNVGRKIINTVNSGGSTMEERAVILYDSWTGEYDRIPMSEWKKMKPEIECYAGRYSVWYEE
jgi:hypothetical protein